MKCIYQTTAASKQRPALRERRRASLFHCARPDKLRIEAVRNADERVLADFHPEFNDERLAALLLHYKARNFPRALSEDESMAWEVWRGDHIKTQLPAFLAALRRLSASADDSQAFLLQELQLWAESVVSADD